MLGDVWQETLGGPKSYVFISSGSDFCLVLSRNRKTSLSFTLYLQKSEFIDRVDLEGNEDRSHSPLSEDKPKTQVGLRFLVSSWKC